MKQKINGLEAGFDNKALEAQIKLNPNEYKQLTKTLLEAMPKLSKHKIGNITTLIRQYYIKRYKRLKQPKYGTINRGFTEPQLQRFFNVIDDDKYKLLFGYEAYMGLRIGEAVELNLSNIDFENRELKLRSEKSGRLDALRIPINLFKDTVAYVREHSKEIEDAQGYLFFAAKNKSHKKKEKELWLNHNYVRRKFREYVVLAKLDEIYDISDESSPKKKQRGLHRLTSHSLRHFAITKFAKNTNGNLVLTSRFARHANPSTTMIYINTDKRELYEAIDQISIHDIENLKKRIAK